MCQALLAPRLVPFASRIVQDRLVHGFELGRSVCRGVVSCASRVDSHALVKIAFEKKEDGLFWFLASSFASALACSIVEQCLRVVDARGWWVSFCIQCGFSCFMSGGLYLGASMRITLHDA